MTVGEYVKEKRNSLGISLRQLSYKIKMSHSNISDFEKGIVKKPLTLEKIVEGLNFTEEEKNIAFKMLTMDIIPDQSKDIYEELKEENTLLKAKLLECEKKLEITHNGTGQIVVGNNNQIGGSSVDGKLQKEFEDLSQRQREKVLKFIEDFIK